MTKLMHKYKSDMYICFKRLRGIVHRQVQAGTPTFKPGIITTFEASSGLFFILFTSLPLGKRGFLGTIFILLTSLHPLPSSLMSYVPDTAQLGDICNCQELNLCLRLEPSAITTKPSPLHEGHSI